MDDRTLLEKAAKAAGLYLVFDGDLPKEITQHWSFDPTEPPDERARDWNPLTDDGDTFRLAADLDLFGHPDYWHHLAVARLDGCTDKRANVRRAIVRAAAAMADKGE